MKAIFSCAAMCALAGVIIYAAVNPTNGLVYQSPLSAIGVGLIGLGLIKHAHDKRAAQQ